HSPPTRGARAPAKPPQHVGVAPLALGAARAELAADEQLLALELTQEQLDVLPEAVVRLRRRERAAGLRVAEDELTQRVVAALEERLGQSPGRARAEGGAG